MNPNPHTPAHTRRHALLGAAALGVVGWSAAARNAVAADRRPAPDPGPDLDPDADAVADRGRITVRRSGRYEVLALLDAHGPFPGRRQDEFPAADERDWARARRLDPAAFGPGDTWELDFRCYAIRRPGGRVTLVDTGVGPAGSPASDWAPVPGHLPEVLRAAGIARTDVEAVVLTHLHEDHYGWAVTPDGTPLFPDARYVIQRAEVAALSDDDSATTYVLAPLRRAGLLHQIDGRTRLLRGVTAVPAPGHTPGHQSVLVDGGREILITGDALVHAVQLADPAVPYRREKDQTTARTTRENLLARASAHRALLATAHLNHPFVRA
ncbi:MBL fold metallo-hydrolase [Streptomyces albiaxialis]|uniref:MBL fold metallo-hydrolase n=1 Tax=Streptomyces albiaxialis TaxID=329523 RepID=A0ABN2X4K4_9ACTN